MACLTGTQTLASLKEASTKVSMPSTLSYKERRHLAVHDPVEYKRCDFSGRPGLICAATLPHEARTRPDTLLVQVVLL